MGDAFSWTCPYCNHDAIVIDSNSSISDHSFNHGNKQGPHILVTSVIVCPNSDCREFTITCDLYKASYMRNVRGAILEKASSPYMEWTLKPKSKAKPFPEYIPKPILDDYREACLIVNDSPKASATLSRRCLQGIIRDFWKISKPRLIDEIAELEGTIDQTTWDAINAVRSIGNIGAHMERDISIIIDVDPSEAQLLVQLIEILLADLYVARHTREENLRKVTKLGAAKAAIKRDGSASKQ